MIVKKIKNYLNYFNVTKNTDIKKIIGLDINDYYISFVLLVGDDLKDFYIENYGFQIIPNNLVKNRLILDVEKIIEVLNNFLKKIKHISKDSILVLPYNSVTTKFFLKQFEYKKENIYELAYKEVQKIASLDDVHFDICDIKDTDKSGVKRFLLALSKKKYVDERILLADKLGLNLLCLDAFTINTYNNNMFFLSKSLPEYVDNTFCILCLDTNHSYIKIFHHDKMLYSNSIRLNIDNFLKDLQSKFNLSYEESVNLILNKTNKYDDDEYNSFIESFLKNISDQVHKAIKIFELTRLDEQDTVSLILVNVFVDLFNDLPRVIFERTGIKSIIPLSIDQVDFSKKINKSYLKNILNISFGISLRGFL